MKLKEFLEAAQQKYLSIVLYDHNDQRIGSWLHCEDLKEIGSDYIQNCEVLGWRVDSRPRYMVITIRT